MSFCVKSSLSSPTRAYHVSVQINGSYISFHKASSIKKASFSPEFNHHRSNRKKVRPQQVSFIILFGKHVPGLAIVLLKANTFPSLKLQDPVLVTLCHCHNIEKDTNIRYPRCKMLQKNVNHICFSVHRLQAFVDIAWAKFVSIPQQAEVFL